MRLCLAAGRLDWRRALAELSSAELAEWDVFMELEPFGSAWEDLRAGTITAAIYNANPFRSSMRVAKPADFFKSLRGPAKKEIEYTPAEAAARAAAFVKSVGGQVIHPKR